MKLEVVYKRVFPSHLYIYIYIYMQVARNRWPTKLVGWDFSFCMLITFIILLLLLYYLAKRISRWTLWVLLRPFTTRNYSRQPCVASAAFTFVRTLFSKLKAWCHTHDNAKYGALSMKLFGSINVQIYLNIILVIDGIYVDI